MLLKQLKLMRCHRLALAISLLSFQSSFSVTAAVPPPNDTCFGAEVIPGTAPFPRFSSVTADVSGATTNGDPTAPTNCYGGPISRSVWYQFTPAVSGLYVLSVNDTETSVPDTLMGVYVSPGGCAGPFLPFGCNDDALGTIRPTQSAFATNLTANVPYYIVIWEVTTNALGTNTMVQLKISKPAIPANDTCAGAEVISPTVPSGSSTNDTYLATATGDPPAPACGAPGPRSVWFRFTPTSAGSYVFSTCRPKVTWINDTLMAIYTSSGACGGPFSPLACDDNGCGFQSTLTATLASGTTYYIVVWDLEPDAIPGETALQVGVSRLLSPQVTTLAASSITSTGAVLKGLANPNTAVTRGWFEWGTTTSYGNTTASQVLGNRVFETGFQQALAGLVPGTLYHYRAVATNTMGRVDGTDQTFKWSTNRPSLTIARRGDGSYRLRFTGSVAQIYKIDASSGLQTWAELGTATDSGTGLFELIDTGAPQRSFYRIRSP